MTRGVTVPNVADSVVSFSGVNVIGSPAAMSNLLLDQVEAGHQFGNRMLDLKAGVHLEEHEVLGDRVDQAFHGAAPR